MNNLYQSPDYNIWMSQSIWTVITTKNHRVGGVSNKHQILIILEAVKSKIKKSADSVPGASQLLCSQMTIYHYFYLSQSQVTMTLIQIQTGPTQLKLRDKNHKIPHREIFIFLKQNQITSCLKPYQIICILVNNVHIICNTTHT